MYLRKYVYFINCLLYIDSALLLKSCVTQNTNMYMFGKRYGDRFNVLNVSYGDMCIVNYIISSLLDVCKIKNVPGFGNFCDLLNVPKGMSFY